MRVKQEMGDNIILAHELVKAYTRKNVSPRSTLKIDLRKDYDSVEWPYLEHVMVGLGFPKLFTQWVMHCVKTMNYTIVVNGQTTQRFDAAKGLRQVDPMSPFLFAIAMEYLSRLLKGLKKRKNSNIILNALSWTLHTYVLQMIYYCFQEEIWSP